MRGLLRQRFLYEGFTVLFIKSANEECSDVGAVFQGRHFEKNFSKFFKKDWWLTWSGMWQFCCCSLLIFGSFLLSLFPELHDFNRFPYQIIDLINIIIFFSQSWHVKMLSTVHFFGNSYFLPFQSSFYNFVALRNTWSKSAVFFMCLLSWFWRFEDDTFIILIIFSVIHLIRNATFISKILLLLKVLYHSTPF